MSDTIRTCGPLRNHCRAALIARVLLHILRDAVNDWWHGSDVGLSAMVRRFEESIGEALDEFENDIRAEYRPD